MAKDKDGRRLTKRGDFIRAEPCQTVGKVGHGPSDEVLDKKDGTYMISLTAKDHGEFLFDVFINNVKLQQDLSISCCHDHERFTFDVAECQEGSTISEDKLTVTHGKA